MDKKIRILVAKAGLDGHDRGAKVVAAMFRDAGFEVIYTGLRQTPEMIVDAALQEDVDVIALSLLSGAHMTIFPKILNLMKEKRLDDVLLTGGGIMGDDDIKKLMDMGVGQLYGPGSSINDAIAYIKNWYLENKKN
jgi:methylmalonyl-CoA mutase C-terminal domain/subunit